MKKNLFCVGMTFVINRLLLISMGTAIIIFVLFSNLTMINGIWKVNSSLKLSHKLYIFQCIIGLFDGFVMLPLYLSIESFENKVKCYMELITFFGICSQAVLQILTLVLMSVLRYYAISRQGNITGKRVMLTYIVLYTFSMCALSIIIWKGNKLHPTFQTYFAIFFAVLNVIVQVTVVTSNVMLLKYVRAMESENRGNNINVNYHKRAIKTILLLSISLTICAAPFAIITFIYTYMLLNGEHDYSDTLKESMQWSHMIGTLYSGINSVIYIFRCKNIVEYYKRIIMNYFVICRAHSSCNGVTGIGNREEMTTAL